MYEYDRTSDVVTEILPDTRPVFFVLDDLEVNLAAAIKGLEKFGKIVTAKNYEEGKRVLEETNPDIAFLDLNFPIKEGGEPQKLGEKFRDEILVPRQMTNVIVTGGFHHNMEATEYYVQLALWMPDNKHPIQPPVHRGGGQAGITKSMPEAWVQAYDNLPLNIMIYLRALRFYKEQMSE